MNCYFESSIWKCLLGSAYLEEPIYNYAALQVDLEEEEGGYERVKNGQDDD